MGLISRVSSRTYRNFDFVPKVSVTKRSITLASRSSALAGTSAKRTSMYYNKPQRNMDEADMLRGLDQERADEKNPFFKAFDKYADLYYNFVYKRRPNSTYPRIFEANKFCRMIAVDGIPGSGF